MLVGKVYCIVALPRIRLCPFKCAVFFLMQITLHSAYLCVFSIALTTPTGTSVSFYTKHAQRIGCHDFDGHNNEGKTLNPGFIGMPRDFLSNYNSICKGASLTCVEKGKEACDAIISTGGDCYGFAVNKDFGVQMYNAKAVNKLVCNKDDGLHTNPGWDVYQRNGSCAFSNWHLGKVEFCL